MTDHILSAVLTFSLLAGGTLAIGSELLGSRHNVKAPVAMARVTLPTVTITGHRQAQTTLAAASVAAERLPRAE